MKQRSSRIAGLGIWLAVAGFASAQTFDAIDKGRYEDNGNHDAGVQTCFAGRDETGGIFDYFRCFFLFDLESLSGFVTSATLRVQVEAYHNFIGSASQDLKFFDVGTASGILTSTHAAASAEGITVYTDLGTGTSFAVATIFSNQVGQTVDIPLNANAISAINNAAGSTFAIGGLLQMSTVIEYDQWVRFSLSAGAGTHQLVLQTGSGPSPLWIGAYDGGGGWYWLSWFGWFYDAGGGWIYHIDLGWLWADPSQSATSFWLWDNAGLGWLWTSSNAAYPWFWWHNGNTWLYYAPGTRNPRWFYNIGAGAWQTL